MYIMQFTHSPITGILKFALDGTRGLRTVHGIKIIMSKKIKNKTITARNRRFLFLTNEVKISGPVLSSMIFRKRVAITNEYVIPVKIVNIFNKFIRINQVCTIKKSKKSVTQTIVGKKFEIKIKIKINS